MPVEGMLKRLYEPMNHIYLDPKNPLRAELNVLHESSQNKPKDANYNVPFYRDVSGEHSSALNNTACT